MGKGTSSLGFLILFFTLSPILIFGTSFDIAWAANTLPTVDAGPDATIDEGGTFSSSGSFTDPDADAWTGTVDYGDGTGPQPLTLVGKTFSLSHTYEQDSNIVNGGPFTVTVTIDDGSGDSNDKALVTVNNVLATIAPISDVTISQGATFAATGSFSDPGSDAWTGGVDYGIPGLVLLNTDGTCPTGLAPNEDGDDCELILNPDKTFNLQHTFLQFGTFTVTVSIIDNPLSPENASTEVFTVTVDNIAPTLNPGIGATINEGDTFTTSGSFSDPGEDSWEVTVDFGDGSGTQNVGFEADKTFELSHVYENDGVFTVNVTVDDGADAVSAPFTVTVNNVLPLVDAGPDATIDEGDIFSSIGTFADPGSETLSASVDYGDGSGSQPLVLNSDNTFSLDHGYTDDGAYTVTVEVIDNAAIPVMNTATVTVNNIAPTVSLGMSSVDDVRTFSAMGSFEDPGADAWTGTVDYGDGAGPEPLTLVGKTFSLSHQYAVNGAYTVEVIITDDDGGVGSASTVVGVFVSDEGPPPDLNSPPDASSSFSQGATFVTTNQDIWTPVTGGSGMVQWNLFTPQTWDESDGDSSIKTLAGQKFGAGIGAGTEGTLRMFSKATELEGKASVNYPGSMSLTHGAANSFLAGENVPLSAQWTLTSGSANINNAKTMGDLELLLRFALDAFVDVEVCFFDCADLAIIPSPDFDTGDTTLFSFDAAQATQQIPGFLQDALFGPVSPMFGPISVSPTTTSVNPSTGRIVAEDTNTFATMAIDIDEVATNLGLAPPLGRSTPNVDDGVELSYDIFDATSDIDFIAHQKLTFDTAVLIQLEFSRPVAGVLGSFVSTTTTPDGKIQTVTYMAGEQIQVTFPLGETEPITVTPTIFLDPSKTKMRNFATIGTDSSVTMTSVAATIMVPSVTVVPSIPVYDPIPHFSNCHCHGFLCTGGHCHHGPHYHKIGETRAVKFNGINFGVGPAWNSGPQGQEMTEVVVANKQFPLSGFNQVTLNNFVLDPEVPPTADADGPYEVLEGSIVQLDGSASFDVDIPVQPLTHNWDLDDDGNFETNGEFVDFLGVDGPALHPVTIKVSDDLNSDTDSSSVTVLNVAPTVEAGDDDSVDEGTLYSYTATFTDPGFDCDVCGTLEDFTATVDWGDNTGIESLTVNETPGSPGVLTEGTTSGSHIYADNGVYTVTVTVTDDDGGVGVDTFDITVNNVVPEVDAGVDREYVIHDITSLDPAEYSDLGFDCDVCGTLEDFTATVNWGEGSDEPLDVTEVPGSPGVSTIGTSSGTHIYRLPGQYTVTVIVTDDDSGATSDTLVNTILGAQDLKNRVISFLSPFDSESKDVGKVIDKINKSLDAKFWIDEVNLNPKKGEKVFDEERSAVKKLEEIIKPDDDNDDDDRKRPASPELKAAAQSSIDILVNADRVLTITAMLEATSTPANDPKDQKKVDKENTRASEDFAKGDAKRDAGKPDKAIEFYEKAWKHAQKAIKIALELDDDDD